MAIQSRLQEITDFQIYVRELTKNREKYLICMAARDTLHGMSEEDGHVLEELGARNLRVGWNGYILVLDRGTVLIDKHSDANGSLLETVELAGMGLQMVSRSWKSGNRAMIVVNGQDLAVNSRGMNIVVVDVGTQRVADSVAFDFLPGNARPCTRPRDPWEGLVSLQEQGTPGDMGEMPFDIDAELEAIIEHYCLDEWYPRYRQVQKANAAIRELSEEWKDTDNVACIAVGDTAKKCQLDMMHFLKNLEPSRRNQVDLVRCVVKTNFDKEHFWYYAWEVSDFAELAHRVWKSYDHVYIISNRWRNFVAFWLRQKNVVYTDLYDIFQRCGIRNIDSRMEYYEFIDDRRESRFYFKNVQAGCEEWALYEERQKYETYRDEELRCIAAQKCFFLSLAMRNFVQAGQWVQAIRQTGGGGQRCADAWVEIQSLLERIRSAFRERKQPDIMAVWVDTVTLAFAKEKMPYISSMQERSVWFENMITMTAFTRETKRGMFTGKKLIDDDTNSIEKINLANSPVLRLLADEGYQLCLFETDEKIFDVPFVSRHCLQPYSQGSERMWWALQQMLLSGKPCFSLLAMMGAHVPYYTSILEDKNVLRPVIRRDMAHLEMDRQIEFYMGLLGNRATSIVFSDHGNGDYWPRNHTFFYVSGQGYRPRKVDGLCCSIDFSKIISQIVRRKEIFEEELVRESVEIQGIPVLRGGRFAETDTPVLKAAVPKYFPPFRGYRGVVTKEHVYIHFAGGREWLSRRDRMQPRLSWYPRPDDICDAELLPGIRLLAGIDYGNEPPEYGNCSTYYASMQEAYEKNLSYNMEKIVLVNLLMSQLGESGTALCPGDGASKELYLAMSLEMRKRIVCVIDSNSECSCASMNLPVVPPDELEGKGIRNILVTSRMPDEAWKDMAGKSFRDAHVFGVYGWFEVNGYHTRHNFYDFAIRSMDAPLPSPTSIPDFLHFASGDSFCEIAVVVVVQDEKTLLDRLHGILKQAPFGIRIYCLDLAGKAADRVKEYQNIDTSIEVVPVDGYPSLSMKMNELLTSVNAKYILFLSSEEYLHGRGLFYLHEIAEQTEADVVAASAAAKPSTDGEPSLASFFTGAFPLKKEARILSATYRERYEEWERMELPDFYGTGLYRLGFLREHEIRFPELRYGWEDIFCFRAMFLSPKYVKVASPVCISSAESQAGTVEEKPSEYAETLVGSMFRYQEEMESFLGETGNFGNNPSMCDAFRERAMDIFDQKYFGGLDLDDDMRNAVCRTVQAELQKKPAIGMWWIKYLFVRSSFPSVKNHGNEKHGAGSL